MRNSIVGVVIGVIILFLSLIVLPTYFLGIVDWRNDMNICQTAARNFIDMVIDNGEVTDKALSDLNLSIASCSSTFTYKYFKEEKVTNPGEEIGTAEVAWVYVEIDENTEWHTGDIVTIVIEQEGLNLFQKLASALLGQSYNTMEIRLSGMVR